MREHLGVVTRRGWCRRAGRKVTALAGGLSFLVAAWARAATLETGDKVRLDLSAEGRVTALRVGAANLPLKGQGGFAIADFKDQAEPANLVPNPGFEDGVNGWRLAKGQVLDTDIFHSGSAAVRLEVPGPAAGRSNLEVIVPVKPGARYQVGVWVRRDKVGVCGVYSSERDERNQLTGRRTQVSTAIPQTDGVWLPVSWLVTTEPATTRLSLRADIYNSTGTLWVDDFFIHELNEGVYEAVTGEVTGDAKQVTIRGSLP